MRSKSGSSIVEASILFPLLILVVAGMITCALAIFQEVKHDSQLHAAAVESSSVVSLPDIRLIMRGIWILQ
jgi:Flp pilus assembly protein TadG